MPQHGWIDSGEVKLHYLDWPGVEPPILCIHGLTANAHVWEIFAEQMAGRYRVIAPDLRGRGQSDKLPSGSYGFAAHARDMAALVQKLELGPVIIVGWSMGAYVAALLAADHPELVYRMVLMDGAASGEGLTEEDIRKQGETSMQRLSTVFPSKAAYLDFWRKSAPWIPWSAPFQRYLEADVEERPDGTVVCRSSIDGILQDLREVAMWDMAQNLPRVRLPALVLWAPLGMVDPAKPLFSRAALDQVTRLLPDAQLVPLTGVNHFTIGLSQTGAVQTVAAMQNFLAQRA